MKIKQTVLILALLVGMVSIIVAPTAFAAKCGGVDTALISCPDQTGIDWCDSANGGKVAAGADGTCPKGSTVHVETQNTGIWGVLLMAINILTAGVGVAAVGGIIFGSILYTTASGKPEQVKKANVVIANTVLGIIIYAVAYSFMNFLIPGGLFN